MAHPCGLVGTLSSIGWLLTAFAATLVWFFIGMVAIGLVATPIAAVVGDDSVGLSVAYFGFMFFLWPLAHLQLTRRWASIHRWLSIAYVGVVAFYAVAIVLLLAGVRSVAWAVPGLGFSSPATWIGPPLLIGAAVTIAAWSNQRIERARAEREDARKG